MNISGMFAVGPRLVLVICALGLVGCQKPEEAPLATFREDGTGTILALGYLSHRGLVVMGADDGVVRLWNPETKQVIARLADERKPVLAVAVDPKERWIAAAHTDRVIRVWSVEKKSLDARFNVPLQLGRNCLVAGPDGDVVAFAARDRSVRLFRISAAEELKKLVGPEATVSAIAISRDGSKVASGDWNGDLTIWDADSGRRAHHIRGTKRDVIEAVAFLDESKFVATANTDQMIYIWDVDSGKRHALLKRDDMAAALCLAQSPDGKVLASADVYANVAIWDIRTWERTRWFGAHDASVVAIAFGKDGTQMITSCSDINFEDRKAGGEVKVWKLK